MNVVSINTLVTDLEGAIECVDLDDYNMALNYLAAALEPMETLNVKGAKNHARRSTRSKPARSRGSDGNRQTHRWPTRRAS